MIRIVAVTSLFAGCAPDDATQPCVRDAEDPIRVSDPSSLGFSGLDVLSHLVLEHTVEIREQGRDAGTRTLVFSFVDDGTAAVEEVDPACPEIVQGQSLAIPVSFTVVAEGWLTASGAGTIRAKSADADEVWIYLTAPASASPDLEASVAAAYDACASVALTFVQQATPEAPWSAGPQGRVDAFGCSLAVPGVVVWGAAEPPTGS